MEEINLTQGGIIAGFIFLALSLIRIIDALIKTRGKESKTPDNRRLKTLEKNKVEKEVCNERHDVIASQHGNIEDSLKEGNERMGKLDTTTALLEQAVLNLTKEFTIYNGKKEGG